MFGEYEIRELPLSLEPIRQKVESFLADNALRWKMLMCMLRSLLTVGRKSLLAEAYVAILSSVWLWTKLCVVQVWGQNLFPIWYA